MAISVIISRITSLVVKILITLTYQYKIKPNPGQIKQFDQYLNICRSVYNYAHAERKDWLNSRKSKVDRCSIVSEYITAICDLI